MLYTVFQWTIDSRDLLDLKGGKQKKLQTLNLAVKDMERKITQTQSALDLKLFSFGTQFVYIYLPSCLSVSRTALETSACK